MPVAGCDSTPTASGALASSGACRRKSRIMQGPGSPNCASLDATFVADSQHKHRSKMPRVSPSPFVPSESSRLCGSCRLVCRVMRSGLVRQLCAPRTFSCHVYRMWECLQNMQDTKAAARHGQTASNMSRHDSQRLAETVGKNRTEPTRGNLTVRAYAATTNATTIYRSMVYRCAEDNPTRCTACRNVKCTYTPPHVNKKRVNKK
jgi:hypothetical protein